MLQGRNRHAFDHREVHLGRIMRRVRGGGAGLVQSVTIRFSKHVAPRICNGP
jgi:hypothetical protein